MKSKQKGLLDITNSRELLIAILVGGGVVAVASLAPAALAMAIPIAKIFKNEDITDKKQKNTLAYLKKAGYISIESQKGTVKIKLTNKGKQKARKNYIKASINMPTRGKWDKKWRIIMFDIPDKHRIKRDTLRTFIKKFDMYQLQKSVWIYPFDCREQIDFLNNFLDLNNSELRYLTVKDIGDDKVIRKHFRI